MIVAIPVAYFIGGLLCVLLSMLGASNTGLVTPFWALLLSPFTMILGPLDMLTRHPVLSVV